MILVAILVGIALCVAAAAVFGQPAVVALASVFSLLVCIGVVADARRAWRDRRTGLDRLKGYELPPPRTPR